jgi:hypothetical protein
MKRFKEIEDEDFYNECNHDDYCYEYEDEDGEETSELDFDY